MTKKKALATAVTSLFIEGEANLTKANATFRTAYKKNHTLGHKLAVSAILHAAKHGNPLYLNDVYNTLDTNHRDALKRFITRIHAFLGGWDGKQKVTNERMTEMKQKGAFLEFKKGAFHVIKDKDFEPAKANKKRFETLAKKIISPDGKLWKNFFDRNNFAETKVFGNDEIIKGIATMIKKATGENDNVESHVSQDLIEELVALQKRIGEPLTEKATLH